MIDAAIPLSGQPAQTTSPLALLSQVGQLKAQQQQSQQRDLEMQGQQTNNATSNLVLAQNQQKAQDAADQRAAFAAATDPQTGQVDRLKLLSTLGKLNPTVAAQTAQGLSQQDTAAAEAQAKAKDMQMAAVTAHLDLKDKLLQGVNDQTTWTNARNIALQNGFQPQELPEQYDPQFVAQAHAQTLSQQQVLANQQAAQKEKDTQANTAATLANTAAHQKVEEQQGAQRIGIEGMNANTERMKAQQSIGDPNAAAQLLVNHDATLSELKARGSTPQFIVQTLAAAKKLDPTYNPQTDEAQFAVAKSPANVGFFGSAKSLTDKGGTLDQLANASKAIPGNQIPIFNSIADAEKAATGNGPIAKYASILLGVSDDYSKVMGGGQGSDTSRTQALKLVPANASPAARAAAIEGIRGAVGSQINSRIGKNPVLGRMYGTDAGSQGGISVTAPDGSVHPFATQQQADAFKALIAQVGGK